MDRYVGYGLCLSVFGGDQHRLFWKTGCNCSRSKCWICVQFPVASMEHSKVLHVAVGFYISLFILSFTTLQRRASGICIVEPFC